MLRLHLPGTCMMRGIHRGFCIEYDNFGCSHQWFRQTETSVVVFVVLSLEGRNHTRENGSTPRALGGGGRGLSKI